MPDVIRSLRINHTLYSWTSCRFSVNGAPFTGLVSVDFEETREVKTVYAAQQDGTPLGWTAGKYAVPNFSIKMLRDSADALTTDLTVLGLGSYGDAEFNMMVQVVEPIIGAIPLTLVADPCRIVGVKEAHEEGTDELLTEFTLGCLAMIRNGKRLWSVQRGIGL